MAKSQFSSASDPTPNLYLLQLTLRHFFVLIAVCALGLLAYLMVNNVAMPSRFLNAARDGELNRLRAYLKSGMDVHYRDGWQTTALMMASSNGHGDCVRYLIDNGADPNERARIGRTPLIWAARAGNMDVAKLLVEYGAVASLADDDGLTAADHARQNGHTQLAGFLLPQ